MLAYEICERLKKEYRFRGQVSICYSSFLVIEGREVYTSDNASGQPLRDELITFPDWLREPGYKILQNHNGQCRIMIDKVYT